MGLGIRTKLAALRRPRLSKLAAGVAGAPDAAVLKDLGAALADVQAKPVTVLDIGDPHEVMLEVWGQFFSDATVIHATTENLVELARDVRPGVIIDSGLGGDQGEAFRALYPVLAAKGVYVIAGADDDLRFTFLRRADAIASTERQRPPTDDFEAYLHTTSAAVTVEDDVVSATKKGHAQRVHLTRSVKDVSDAAVLRDVGEPYDRLPDARIVGHTHRVEPQWAKLNAVTPVAFEPAASGELTDVTVLSQGVVLTSDGDVVFETLNCAHNIRRSSGLYRPLDDSIWVTEAKPKKVRERFDDDRRYVLLKQTWDSNYGHWLIDSFPKMGLLQEIADPADCTFVLNDHGDNPIRQIMIDSLAMAGVPEDNLLFLPVGGTYEFARLTVLGALTQHPIKKSPFAIEFLERIAGQHEPGAAKRIYLSRNATHRRRLVNEDEVLEVLAPHGYVPVRTEELTLAEQMAVFAGADHVIGNMGAAMTNLAFSPRGVNVMSLATERMAHDYFYDIVCLKRGTYVGVQGRTTDDPPTMGSDFTIDINVLQTCINEWHGGPS
ncbi:hypothetical protein GCM10022234_11270 [Aeromicrobium panaciterrae]|uniref:glycosyltransferase family 61 protein n=1 Tax=Aeromicrobium panaciterrae TaxID=363861 RepID=UPI0031CE4725